jgi:hypothetical protein
MYKKLFLGLTFFSLLFTGSSIHAEEFFPEKLRRDDVLKLEMNLPHGYVCRGAIPDGQNAFIVDTSKKTAWVVDETDSEDLLAIKLDVTRYIQKRDGNGPALVAVLRPSLYGDRVNPDATFKLKITNEDNQYTMAINVEGMDIALNFPCTKK